MAESVRVGVVLAALAIAALAAGCGEKAEGGDGGGPALPTGADDVVLQISTGGGYVPPIDALREYPEAVLYGDGRLVTAIEPPGLGTPVRPRLEVRQLSEGQMEAVLAAALDAGLGNPLEDYGYPHVTDLATTTFTLRTAEGTTEASVYALGYENDASLPARDERDELAGLAEGLADPESLLGEDAPEPESFEPDAWLVSRVGGSEKCELVEGGFPSEVAAKDGRVAIRPAIGLADSCDAED